MKETNQSDPGSRARAAVCGLLLPCFVLLAFLMQVFSYTVSLTPYCIIAILFSGALLVLRHWRYRKAPLGGSRTGWFYLLWAACLLVVYTSWLFRHRAKGVLLDCVFLTCGVFLCLSWEEEAGPYDRTLRVIPAAAAVFAASVLVQRFLPDLYRRVIALFPKKLGDAFSGGSGTYPGFASNAGFTAGYLLAGILALLHPRSRRVAGKVLNYLLLAFLALAFLFTGKRGHTLFGAATLGICFICSARSKKWVLRILVILLLLAVLAGLFFLARDVEPFSRVPIVQKLSNTLARLEMGKDATGSRQKLYAVAIQLIREHPLFGIGWGKYRVTLPEIVTSVEKDTHNIYLQLLCETGIFGFLLFAAALVTAWVHTLRLYRAGLRNTDPALARWRPALVFSFAWQTFFLLYGLTGNPLYDQYYQIIYFFALAVMIAFTNVTARSAAWSRKAGRRRPAHLPGGGKILWKC